MRFENGKVVFEIKSCIMCTQSPGKYHVRMMCPNDGIAQRGVPCVTCKATTKRHNYYSTGEVVACGTCNGATELLETRTDYISKEQWQSLDFKVFRSNRRQLVIESIFGAGCYSCTDYGRHKDQSDDELIANVKASMPPQACKVIDDANKVLPIAILCNDNGYSVVAYKGGKLYV